MPTKARTVTPELTDYEKRIAIAREVGCVEFLGERINGRVPQPPSQISATIWDQHYEQFRFIIMEDGSVHRDVTPTDLHKRWWDAEVKLGFCKEHDGGSFSTPEMFASYDHNTHASLRVQYLACYWRGPEGIKVAITDRFTNNVEFAGMNIEQAITVMNMLKAMVA